MTPKSQYIANYNNLSGLPIFMMPWWLDVVCAQWDVALILEDQKIVAAWPFPIEQKLGIALIRTPLMTPYLGPYIAPNEAITAKKWEGYQIELTQKLLALLPQAPYWQMAITPGNYLADTYKEYGLQPEARQTYRIPLAGAKEDIFSQFKDTLRRNIRSAEKDITITSKPEAIDTLYTYYTTTLAQKGKTQPEQRQLWQKLMAACQQHGNGNLWVAEKQGVIQGMLWTVHDDLCTYHLTSAKNPEADDYKAISCLLWHSIQQAHQSGHQYYDLEGSMDAQVARFYRNFTLNKTLYFVLRRNQSWLWRLKELVRG
jgi:hypothetical protein